MKEKKVPKEEIDMDVKKKEPNAFVRLKERMSNRSKGESKIKKDNCVQIISTDAKEDKGEKSNNDKNKSEESKFGRVLERLSMRSKQRNKGNYEKGENGEVSEKKQEKNDNGKVQKDKVNGCSILNDRNHLNEDHSSMTKKDQSNEDKVTKDKNFIQRLIRSLSFKSKKKKPSETNNSDRRDMNGAIVEVANINKVEDGELNLNETEISRSSSENSLAEDLEIQALCKNDKDEEVVTPSVPIITTNRPPLPTSRRIPLSATTTQSRPVSQLDAALKQFKVSTAASRENLRSSRVDLEKMDETVRDIVASRPSSRAATPTQGGWRSRAPPENRQLSEQWAKLSASLTDLR